MSNGDAANHWRAIEEEKLRKRIAELERVAEAAVRFVTVYRATHPYYDALLVELRAAGYLGGVEK